MSDMMLSMSDMMMSMSESMSDKEMRRTSL